MHILRWFLALFIGVGAVLCGGSIEDQFSQWENIVRITVGRMDANTGIVTFTICGGSLISSLLVLTSADCTSQSSVPDIKVTFFSLLFAESHRFYADNNIRVITKFYDFYPKIWAGKYTRKTVKIRLWSCKH